MEEQKKVGRPPKPGHGRVQFRLDGSLYPILQQAAAVTGENPNDLARKIVIAALEKSKK